MGEVPLCPEYSRANGPRRACPAMAPTSEMVPTAPTPKEERDESLDASRERIHLVWGLGLQGHLAYKKTPASGKLVWGLGFVLGWGGNFGFRVSGIGFKEPGFGFHYMRIPVGVET